MRAIPLVRAKPDTIINVMMDASDIAIEAVLRQHLARYLFFYLLSPTVRLTMHCWQSSLQCNPWPSFQLEACEFYALTDQALDPQPQL